MLENLTTPEAKHISRKMKDLISPFAIPVNKWVNDRPSPNGSGNFLDLNDKKWLLTNYHVAEHANPSNNSFCAHAFLGDEESKSLDDEFAFERPPKDFAVWNITERWSRTVHSSKGVPLNLFAKKHDAVEGEIFAFIGFAGQNTKVDWEGLTHTPTIYLAAEGFDGETLPPRPFDVKLHTPIHYYVEDAIELAKTGQRAPSPKGFSGALLWNTRFMEAKRNNHLWDSSHAQVTGILLWHFSSIRAIMSTKVEHLRKFLQI